MALRSGYVERVEIPGEDGEWMELRLLGWKDLDAAQRARQTDSFDNLRRMGKELYQMMQEAQTAAAASNPAAPAQAADPLANYDLGTVLTLGIAAWSYDAEVTPETIGQLDPQTAEWAARVIIGARTESEADRKNGSGRSTTP